MNIRDEIIALHAEMTKYRRALHEFPQTAFEETFANSLVAEKLDEWGIPYQNGMAETGIVATIEGKKNTSGKRIGFRVDMDALNIMEEPNKEWMSQVPGKMHACGHDGHTATLLGAAKYLAAHNNFDGTLHLIFQPAEEGAGGAKRMIEEGLFETFPCDEVYALHNWPWLPRGQIAMRAGEMMAGSSKFMLTINGVGGHAAQPEKTIDPIVIGGQIITAIQNVISRYTSPTNRAVVSITNFNAGTGAHNIIPERAELIGTVRTFSMETRKSIQENLLEISRGIAQSMGADVEFDFQTICDPTINDKEMTSFSAAVAAQVVGKDHVDDQYPALMISEDFGAMLGERPGAYIFIGQGEPDDLTAPSNFGLHTPDYDFNDNIIPIGMEYWASLAENRMPLEDK